VEHFVITQVVKYGYAAILVLMVAESACIPIPSEVTMLFGGALTSAAVVTTFHAQHHLNFIVVGLVGSLGNLVGSWIAYGVGRAGGRPLIGNVGWEATTERVFTATSDYYLDGDNDYFLTTGPYVTMQVWAICATTN
jgi:membrane protein DedA with SNARE-associated domain